MEKTITTQARDLKKGDYVLYTGHLDDNQHELMKVLEVKINGTDLARQDWPCVDVLLSKISADDKTSPVKWSKHFIFSRSFNMLNRKEINYNWELNSNHSTYGPVEMDWKTEMEVLDF